MTDAPSRSMDIDLELRIVLGMYKTIIVGYDGSERALRAVDEASLMATAFGSSLHLVTALAKDEIHEFGTGSDRQVLSDVEMAKRSLKRLAKSYSHLDVSAEARVGGIANVLLEEADAVDADVIVVGNKNVQGLGRVLGSVAENVAQKANCAVLISNTAFAAQEAPVPV